MAALWRGRSALILDEPTSVLAPADVEQLFKTMRRLAAEGCAVIFTSHKLREVTEVCDTITVMRHGRIVDTVPRDGVDAEGLAADRVVAEMSGVGSGSVRAEKSLKADVSGVGSLTWKGAATEVSTNVSGIGRVSKG